MVQLQGRLFGVPRWSWARAKGQNPACKHRQSHALHHRTIRAVPKHAWPRLCNSKRRQHPLDPGGMAALHFRCHPSQDNHVYRLAQSTPAPSTPAQTMPARFTLLHAALLCLLVVCVCLLFVFSFLFFCPRSSTLTCFPFLTHTHAAHSTHAHEHTCTHVLHLASWLHDFYALEGSFFGVFLSAWFTAFN